QQQHLRQHVVQVAAVEQAGQEIPRGLLPQLGLQRLDLVDLLRQLLVDGLELGLRALGAAAARLDLVEVLLQPAQLGLQRAREACCARSTCSACQMRSEASACAAWPSRSWVSAIAWWNRQRTRRLRPS